MDHDQKIFTEPEGWCNTSFNDSPLCKDFNKIWNKLKDTYVMQLTGLSYRAIPDEGEVEKSFINLIKRLQ